MFISYEVLSTTQRQHFSHRERRWEHKDGAERSGSLCTQDIPHLLLKYFMASCFAPGAILLQCNLQWTTYLAFGLQNCHWLAFSYSPFLLLLPWNHRLRKHLSLWSVNNMCCKIWKAPIYSNALRPASSSALNSNLSPKQVTHRDSLTCQTVWLHHLRIPSSRGSDLDIKGNLAYASSVLFPCILIQRKNCLHVHCRGSYRHGSQDLVLQRWERERRKEKESWLITGLRDWGGNHRSLEQGFV